MKQIRQQVQQAQSISLNSQQSVIEQYNQLEFSDQIDRNDNSSDEAELSAQKLKFLGIDKFPGPYAPKLRDNSQTQINSRKQTSGQAYSNTNFYPSRLQDDLYYRKKKQNKNKQYSLQQKQDFNIDSFLNSRPISYKNAKDQVVKQKIDQYQNRRKSHNSNPLKKVLEQQNIIEHNRRKKIFGNEYHNKKNDYSQKNDSIKRFVQDSLKNQHMNLHREYQKCYLNGQNDEQSQKQQSITLITLPQPKETIDNRNDLKYRHKNIRHRKNYSLNQIANQEQLMSQQTSRNLYQIRFQQAKINFMDRFLPQSMKIANNPYNFLKYSNAKANNYLRMI